MSLETACLLSPSSSSCCQRGRSRPRASFLSLAVLAALCVSAREDSKLFCRGRDESGNHQSPGKPLRIAERTAALQRVQRRRESEKFRCAHSRKTASALDESQRDRTRTISGMGREIEKAGAMSFARLDRAIKKEKR